MKPQFILSALCACMAFSIVSCGKSQSPAPQPQQQQKTSPTAPNAITINSDGKIFVLKASQRPSNADSPQLTGINPATGKPVPAALIVDLSGRTNLVDPTTGLPLLSGDIDANETPAFVHANILFNQQDYTNAMDAYVSFIKDYPSSPRIPIVKQRMADIVRVISGQIDANKRGIAEELAKSHALSVKYGYGVAEGVSNLIDGTVVVRGYGKTESDAFAAAYKQVPKGIEAWSIDHYPINVETNCYEIGYKP